MSALSGAPTALTARWRVTGALCDARGYWGCETLVPSGSLLLCPVPHAWRSTANGGPVPWGRGVAWPRADVM
ncbi:hypothetical protein NDU88_005471 [Pleurodeles waltl]|uniref:Uncharacterized protein n=1 Tax=Pleurodeles waltl TaxID=8319 RepID=A0AAV7X1A8_PLEWA|nr:hypothetical protein NDU88_005471 [Pleurodeles waltl]